MAAKTIPSVTLCPGPDRPVKTALSAAVTWLKKETGSRAAKKHAATQNRKNNFLNVCNLLTICSFKIHIKMQS